MFRRIPFFLVLAVTIGLVSCGGDDPAPDVGLPAQSPSATLDYPVDYCVLAHKMDRAGSKFFKALESDDDATIKDYKEAEAAFVEKYSDEFDAVVEAAPDEIKSEIEVLIASVRARGGLGEAPPRKEARAAEQTVKDYENENCP